MPYTHYTNTYRYQCSRVARNLCTSVLSVFLHREEQNARATGGYQGCAPLNLSNDNRALQPHWTALSLAARLPSRQTHTSLPFLSQLTSSIPIAWPIQKLATPPKKRNAPTPTIHMVNQTVPEYGLRSCLYIFNCSRFSFSYIFSAFAFVQYECPCFSGMYEHTNQILGAGCLFSFPYLHICRLLKRNWLKCRKTVGGWRNKKAEKHTISVASKPSCHFPLKIHLGVGVRHVPLIQTVVCWHHLDTCVDSLSIYIFLYSSLTACFV